MTVQGADVGALKELAQRFSAEGEVVGSVPGVIEGLMASTLWVGPDATQFQSTWDELKAAVTAAAGVLTQLGIDLGKQHDQQVAASTGGAVGGAVAGTSPFGGLGPFGAGGVGPGGAPGWLDPVHTGVGATGTTLGTAGAVLGEDGLSRPLSGDPPKTPPWYTRPAVINGVRVAGIMGPAFDVAEGGFAAAGQVHEDRETGGYTNAQLAARATTRGVLEGGGSFLGGTAGAFLGGAGGGALGGAIGGAIGLAPGAAIGAPIGAGIGAGLGNIGGGIAGSEGGEWLADRAVDPVSDGVGWTQDRVEDVGGTVADGYDDATDEIGDAFGNAWDDRGRVWGVWR